MQNCIEKDCNELVVKPLSAESGDFNEESLYCAEHLQKAYDSGMFDPYQIPLPAK